MFLGTLARCLCQAPEKKILAALVAVLSAWRVACAVLLFLLEGTYSRCKVSVLRSSCATWQSRNRRLACSDAFQRDFHGILARIFVSVGSNFLHSIGALVLMHESGIRSVHARLGAWFMTCHEVEVFRHR